MVIERFRGGDAPAVYRRASEKGRMLPDGLRYVDSWTDTAFHRCFQLMECDDPAVIGVWTARWDDLVEFEVVPVMTSKEAFAAMAPRI